MMRKAAAMGLALSLCVGAVLAEDVPEIAPALETPGTESPASEAPGAQTPQAKGSGPDSAQVQEPIVPASAAPAAPADTQPKAEAPGAGAGPTAPSFAAPSVEAEADPADSGDITVEVDAGNSRNKDKSLSLAMLLSATLPGTGELYLNEKGNAKAFFLTEAGFWASLYVAFIARESYLTSARNYASDFAGIEASGKSAGFLETMANYRSYQEKQHRQDSYELAQILSGKRDGNYDIAAVPENYWDFGSSVNPENTNHWRTFQSTLRYYRASKVAISFAIGALALNRVVSLANTLRVYKRTSARGLGLNIIPEIGPDHTGTRLTLQF